MTRRALARRHHVHCYCSACVVCVGTVAGNYFLDRPVMKKHSARRPRRRRRRLRRVEQFIHSSPFRRGEMAHHTLGAADFYTLVLGEVQSLVAVMRLNRKWKTPVRILAGGCPPKVQCRHCAFLRVSNFSSNAPSSLKCAPGVGIRGYREHTDAFAAVAGRSAAVADHETVYVLCSGGRCHFESHPSSLQMSSRFFLDNIVVSASVLSF